LKLNSNYVVESINRLDRLGLCDWADVVLACVGCQAVPWELCTHGLFIGRSHGTGAWSGLLCLDCIAALPESLPTLLMVKPLVACLHLNQTLGWGGGVYCRDCKGAVLSTGRLLKDNEGDGFEGKSCRSL
jgi:hypothetical protein